MNNCKHYKDCGLDYCLPEIASEGIECPEFEPRPTKKSGGAKMIHHIKAIEPLIDATIERQMQPETAPEVQRAIFECNSALDEAFLDFYGKQSEYHFAKASVKLFLAALQQQRTEPCEWCDIDPDQYFDVNWYRHEDGALFAVRPVVNYCPSCGRRLEVSD